MASRSHEVDVARFFHEVTKHSYTSVRSDGHMPKIVPLLYAAAYRLMRLGRIYESF
jgi:hypothetical protein